MLFQVTRLRVKGVRVPEEQWTNEPAVTGDLRTCRVRDEVTGAYVLKATVAERNGDVVSLLPELSEVSLVGIANSAMVLRGFELVKMKAGDVQIVQEWWVRPVSD